jgi:hypothetical protein
LVTDQVVLEETVSDVHALVVALYQKLFLSVKFYLVFFFFMVVSLEHGTVVLNFLIQHGVLLLLSADLGLESFKIIHNLSL